MRRAPVAIETRDQKLFIPWNVSVRRNAFATAAPIARKLAARVEGEASEGVGGESLFDVVAFAGLVPVERRQVEETMLRPTGQETEDVAQIGPGLDGAELAAREQRGEDGIHGAPFVASDEEPILAPDRFAS